MIRTTKLYMLGEIHRRRRSIGGGGVTLSSSREGWQAATTDMCLRVR